MFLHDVLVLFTESRIIKMNKKRVIFSFITIIFVNMIFLIYAKPNGISYFEAYLYHFFIVYYCSLFLKNEFGTVFLDTNENLLATSFLGVVCGCLLAIVVMLLFKSFFVRTPIHSPMSVTLILRILNYFIFQFLVAISEEVLFRFYLYEEFGFLGIKKLMNVLICSFLFAYAHFYLTRNFLQFVITFTISLFLFYLKNKINSFNLLIVTHFVYNIVINFLL